MPAKKRSNLHHADSETVGQVIDSPAGSVWFRFPAVNRDVELVGVHSGHPPYSTIRFIKARSFKSRGTGLVVAIVLAYGASRFESRPVVEMTRSAREMASGGYGGHIPGTALAARELHDLARALRDMYSQIQDRVAQLSTEKTRLEAILDSVSEGILVTDPDNRVALANPALTRMFGLESWRPGMPLVELVRNTRVEEAIAETSN